MLVLFIFWGEKVTFHSLQNRVWLLSVENAVEFVLKAKSQSSVVDGNDSIDLNPGDAVNLKVWWKKARLQELTARIKPVGCTRNRQSVTSLCCSEFVNAFYCVTLPWVAGAALLQTNISNTFQLRDKKLDGVVHRVCCLGQEVLIPLINPELKRKSIFFKRGKLVIVRHETHLKNKQT